MNKIRNNPRFLSGFVRLLACLLLAGSSSLQALPNDNRQPIHIQANTAVHDDQKGLTTYQGNVIITQGSLLIEADRIEIHNNKEKKIDRLVATGKPAHLQLQPEVKKQIVHARGNKIEYFVNDERIRLEQEASLIQEGSTVISDQIDYYIKEQKIKARGAPASPSNKQKPKRVEVVIPPRAISSEETATSSKESTISTKKASSAEKSDSSPEQPAALIPTPSEPNKQQ
jgi:lipopolysaccharide export system protein LptA